MKRAAVAVLVAVRGQVFQWFGAVALAYRLSRTSMSRRALPVGALLIGSLSMAIPASTNGSEVPRCARHQLRISLGPESAGLGHLGAPIRFRNNGSVCTLRGYPKVEGLTADGRLVRISRSRRGYLGGARNVSTITLAHGKTASALLEGIDPGFTTRPCRAVRYVRAAPPATTHRVQLRLRYPFCYPAVHPVVAGNSGSDLGP
jgi:hypothetical protein